MIRTTSDIGTALHPDGRRFYSHPVPDIAPDGLGNLVRQPHPCMGPESAGFSCVTRTASTYGDWGVGALYPAAESIVIEYVEDRDALPALPTADHLVMTDHGWVRVSELEDGRNVVTAALPGVG